MGSDNGPLHFELITGAKMPSIGLGTWRAEPGLVGQAVITAVKAGYRHIDCATAYRNEKEIGEALNQLFTSGIVKREDLWITSKLWSSDHAPEDVPKALDRTLEWLQLDYLDLYLIHWPIRTKPGSSGFTADVILREKPNLEETWYAMEEIYAAGKAKAIGVSNYSVKKLNDLLGYAKVKPAVNQVECHIGWRQSEMHKVCKDAGIHLTAYSPLGSPGTWMKGDILQEPLLIEIAGKLNKSPAQVALRWGIQSGHSILAKSTNEVRIKENLSIFDWTIPEDLFEKLSTEIPQKRLLRAEFILVEGSPWESVHEFWDGEM